MPTTKEFTIQLEDRPGTLGRFCRALADRGVNIIAIQSVPAETGKNTVRLVTDNPETAKAVLQSERTTYTETQVAQTKLQHRPGSLAFAAERLGEAKININYTYVGIEPGGEMPLVIFGVADAAQAAKILDEAAKLAA
jgi:hypothetical protein